MEKPKIALIGVGRWGKKLAKELATEADLCYLVHGDSEDTKNWIKENFPNTKSSKDLDEVFKDSAIESVVIATPIKTHFEITLQALKLGKNVLLEKPGGENPEELDILIEEAKKRNLVLQIGYEFTFSQKLKEIQKEIEDRKIERISFVWEKWGTFETHPVVNLLVHEISIAKVLGLNNLEIIKYEETKGEHSPDKVWLEAKSGETEISFYIDRVSKDPKKLVTIEADGKKREWLSGEENLINAEIKSFVRSIQEKTPPFIDGQFAKEILETIEKIPYSKN